MLKHAEHTAQKWLTKGGVRPTRQRMTLAALLIGDGHNRHITAEGLFGEARAAGETVSLATVYNTLKAFCEAGLLNEFTVDGTKSYFDTRTDEHPHYYWEDTGRLIDAPASELKMTKLPSAPKGSTISRIDVIIRLKHKA